MDDLTTGTLLQVDPAGHYVIIVPPGMDVGDLAVLEKSWDRFRASPGQLLVLCGVEIRRVVPVPEPEPWEAP